MYTLEVYGRNVWLCGTLVCCFEKAQEACVQKCKSVVNQCKSVRKKASLTQSSIGRSVCRRPVGVAPARWNTDQTISAPGPGAGAHVERGQNPMPPGPLSVGRTTLAAGTRWRETPRPGRVNYPSKSTL